MHRLKTEGQPRRLGTLILILLCVGLLLSAATLSVTHGHADGASHADCGMCTTAHVGMIATAVEVLLTLPQTFEKIEFDLPSAPHRELESFALFTRPPPADALRS